MNEEKQKQPYIGIHLQSTRENKRSQILSKNILRTTHKLFYTQSIEQSKQKINNHCAHLDLQFYFTGKGEEGNLVGFSSKPNICR